jgi:hypothetical protein
MREQARGVAVPYDIDTNLYIHDLKTGKREKLLAETFDSAWLTGQHLLVATSFEIQGLLLLRPDGSKPIVIRDGPKGGFIAVSQNGRRVAWNCRNSLRIVEWPADPSKILAPGDWKSIGFVKIPKQAEELALSPDGRWLALRLPGSKFGEYGSQFVILDPATGLARRLGFVKGSMYGLRWSRNGEYQLLPHRDGISSSPELWGVPAERTSLRPLSELNWSERIHAHYSVLLRFPDRTGQVEWKEAK